MRSDYKRLGDYIREVKARNSDGKVHNLLGINIDKFFTPSVANIVGTDLTVYKVVKNGQFACNRMHVGRDKRLPVALSDKPEDFIVSPAYDVFEVIDERILLPEYLMMWFSRKEFDRNSWFYTDADVRGGLSWGSFCDMKLPIPHTDKQKEIVKEYHTIVNRINLNNRFIKKLEETAQALYKHWFVDFEFPNEIGQPYKSSRGEMVESELGMIPKGWRVGSINELTEVIDGDRGGNYPKYGEMSKTGFCLFLNAGNVTRNGFNFYEKKFITEAKDKVLRKGKLELNDVVLTSRGTIGNIGFYSNVIRYNNIRINSGMVILRAREFHEFAIFVYLMLQSTEVKKLIENFISGSAQPQLPINDLIKIIIIIPKEDILFNFSEKALIIQKNIDEVKVLNEYLIELKKILLAKLVKLH